MIQKKNILFQWINPALWGVMMYNVLRAITDIAKRDNFWAGEMRTHLISLLVSILICYAFNFLWKYKISQSTSAWESGKSIKENYLYVFAEIFLPFNAILILGHWTDLLHMGAGKIDYMLINVAYIPLLLLFYTLTKNRVMNQHFQEKTLLLERLKAEKYETELKFLKSQYHPHFLFNALNMVYFQIDDDNSDAKQTIEQLSDLLRYQLYDFNKKVTLAQELKYIKSYLSFQKLRKSEKLVLNTTIDPSLDSQKVHPLLFQPLLENAFKYVDGLQQINLAVNLVENQVHFEVTNSISRAKIATDIKSSGIGIENLKRRLDLLYPDKYVLDTRQTDGFFVATLTLTLDGD